RPPTAYHTPPITWYNSPMLEHTFLHLPGVGRATERLLWEQGVLTWRDALRSSHHSLKWCRLADLRPGIEESMACLEAGDVSYFHRRLPAREQWRLFRDFADRAVCLDIETTGLSYGPGLITMIGLYDGRRYQAFVRGQNLHRFPEEIRRYALVITYNGQRFDLPFIQAEMGPVLEGLAHFDVMYALRRLGYRGGLKVVEQETGLARPSDLAGLNGYDAVLLWRLYQRGHRGALATMLRYNAEDVVGLLPLAGLAYNQLSMDFPFDAPSVPMPRRPFLDLLYDRGLVESLRRGR
ncbi:MAG: ribonuclease H-like domain-containing protein, partial [Dehalococcoidia bacterium]